MKRMLKIKPIYECRCNGRHSLLFIINRLRLLFVYYEAVELEHLKIETRLTIDKFTSVMGEYVTER
jgi:hypothetical protein